jgi:hypothetical protein
MTTDGDSRILTTCVGLNVAHLMSRCLALNQQICKGVNAGLCLTSG